MLLDELTGWACYTAGSPAISTESDPSASLVTADGVFATPDPGRARALFPGAQPGRAG